MAAKIAARVFLASDAAHTMTPYAGKGANSGIQDAQNLAWKLAAVLNYNSGDVLLDTYDAEHTPVGTFYVNLSGEIADTKGLVNDTLLITKAKILIGLPIYTYPSGPENFAIYLSTDKFNGKPGTRMSHL